MMLRRLFSNKWIRGNLNSFLEAMPLVLTGSEAPFVVVSGPFESGKTSAINMTLSTLKETDFFSDQLTAYVNVKDSAHEDPFAIVIHLNSSVTTALKYIQSDLDLATTQELLNLISTCAKKIGNYEENQTKPEETFQEQLKILNAKLEDYSKVPKLKALTSASLLQTIEKISISDAYELVSTGIIISSMEERFGDETADLIVKVLKVLNRFCLENNKPTVLLRVEDTHLFYRSEATRDFFTNLVHSVIRNKGCTCIFEGASQFEEALKTIKEHENSVNWFHIDDFNREETMEILVEAKPNLSEKEKELYWDWTYGNLSLVYNIASAIQADELTPTEITGTISKNTLEIIDGYLNSLMDPEEKLAISEKFMGISNLTMRAVLYVLKNLSEEKSQQISVTIEEFSNNIVMQDLVIQRLLSYCAVSETLSFDKGFLPKLLPQSSHWSLTTSWVQMKKNRYVYDKICGEKLPADNRS